jgi:hypothetical protein
MRYRRWLLWMDAVRVQLEIEAEGDLMSKQHLEGES